MVGERFDARVLEPSPPAVDDGDWFADDPVALGDDLSHRPIVSPVATGHLTWHEWLFDHRDQASWAAARWLGAHRRLGSAPATLVETRVALHRLAVYVLAPARRRANGKIGLRWTLGGFGTPFFRGMVADEQVRVVGTGIVRQVGQEAETEPITSLHRAAKFVLDGAPDVSWATGFDVPPPGDVYEELPIDADAAAFIGDWFGFAWSVLEELRSDLESSMPSRVQLWPEHFDAAFDCLPEHRRATFGASPGDAAIPEPYLYVIGAGVATVPSPLWNATAFRGAALPLSRLVGAADQHAAALGFFRACRTALQGPPDA